MHKLKTFNIIIYIFRLLLGHKSTFQIVNTDEG